MTVIKGLLQLQAEKWNEKRIKCTYSLPAGGRLECWACAESSVDGWEGGHVNIKKKLISNLQHTTFYQPLVFLPACVLNGPLKHWLCVFTLSQPHCVDLK